MNPQDTSFGKYKYEKGKIYKLCCKDPTITEIYIGSTLNQYRRKHEHKSNCNNPNRKMYNYYVYQFIRENGGFENWDIVILEEYPTENKNELVWKEREYIELLQPALNSVKRPVITTEENREANRKYREENPEKYREKNRRWCEENSEKLRESHKKYYEENSEKCRDRSRKYREDNPEKCRQIIKKYYEENKEKILEKDRRYRENNKQKISERNKQRVNCDICNKELARSSLSKHKKTFHST